MIYEPEHYQISAHLFVRMLGFIYFFAFGAFLFQIKGLIGSHGILPIANFLKVIQQRFGRKRFYYVPSLFWFWHTNTALMTVTAVGTILSVLLMLGIWPPLMLVLLYIFYFSIVSTGQDFLSFGWEMFLLELTVNAFFLSLTQIPNIFIWLSINFLLFRFHLQGGAVKLQSRDPNWRNLTAIAFHYQSQPIPNTQAWYVYKLPMWFHKASTAMMHFIELVVPFGVLFGNDEMRLIVFFFFFGLQFIIWFTGNFSFLNYMTAIFCVILISDKYLSPIFGPPPAAESPSILLTGFLSLAGMTLLGLQMVNLWYHLVKPLPSFSKILNWISPLHIANRYGIFAIMTTERYEIVIEGSDDGINWKEYCFYYKPSETTRRPRRISPYQPRIDWQIWFLPFTQYEYSLWFQQFLGNLLLGTKDVLALIRVNPFPNKPPKYIRALSYLYEFSNPKTKKETGQWWIRKLTGHYSPILSLKELK